MHTWGTHLSNFTSDPDVMSESTHRTDHTTHTSPRNVTGSDSTQSGHARCLQLPLYTMTHLPPPGGGGGAGTGRGGEEWGGAVRRTLEVEETKKKGSGGSGRGRRKKARRSRASPGWAQAAQVPYRCSAAMTDSPLDQWNE